ncbi:ARF GTP-binding ADP ribosylation factor [Tubulinosema ratisbonensis]|uniref:ARF GTP-binding ADP ribosylation factor n=1 Tax=Tubulinosema ratisbonensis TaxID=291195 RepID=A0A437AQ51_9MICR|nr:ARF GTP-binding ADP ribosylation factor [Tubulinosema ratisbonensis]
MSFASSLKSLQTKKELTFLLVGLDNSGKTTIITNLCNIKEKILPTFGYKKYYLTRNNLNIKILDIGGQECFREYWFNYYGLVNGIIFVIDMSDKRDFLKYFEGYKKSIPLLIYGNKKDLGDIDLKVEGNVKFLKVCAIKNEGLEEGIDWLINQCINL